MTDEKNNKIDYDYNIAAMKVIVKELTERREAEIRNNKNTRYTSATAQQPNKYYYISSTTPVIMIK